jgi:hypothetical protein
VREREALGGNGKIVIFFDDIVIIFVWFGRLAVEMLFPAPNFVLGFAASHQHAYGHDFAIIVVSRMDHLRAVVAPTFLSSDAFESPEQPATKDFENTVHRFLRKDCTEF